ncbi:ANTAR domain-containing response regulator [Thalassotalea profundi]|uniref:Transcriptional regulator n=1 Tax=Thalassotalea profundi TaxID=2036687 RepID=A0ABQ3IJX4_9GAMM|nr:ANTAR domain-containing protein [Thalassotalea profundi]GHE83348.1 transcriptional regulator [Thalassotalea profundi]
MNLSMNMTTTDNAKFNVLLVENDPAKSNQLIKALGSNNYDIVHVNQEQLLQEQKAHGKKSLLEYVEQEAPDILILDIESPDRDVIDSLTLLDNTSLMPIVMFSDQTDTRVINSLIKAGVSAYICGSVDSRRIGSLLNIAMIRFNENQKQANRKISHPRLITDPKIIEQATQELIQLKGITAKEAYLVINKTAMSNNQSIEDVAKNIISLAKMLGNS